MGCSSNTCLILPSLIYRQLYTARITAVSLPHWLSLNEVDDDDDDDDDDEVVVDVDVVDDEDDDDDDDDDDEDDISFTIIKLPSFTTATVIIHPYV